MARATAAPMPVLAPVTRTALFFRSFMVKFFQGLKETPPRRASSERRGDGFQLGESPGHAADEVLCDVRQHALCGHHDAHLHSVERLQLEGPPQQLAALEFLDEGDLGEA